MGRNKSFDEQATLQKAVELFRSQGFKATTPEQIVTALGINRSSLYNTFGDKKQLFVQALQQYSRTSVAALKAAASEASNAKEAVQKILQLSLDGCFENKVPKGCLLVNSVIEFGPDETDVSDLVTQSLEANRQTLFKVLKAGQQKGDLSSTIPAGALADYFMNCIAGLTISTRSGVSRATCQKVVDNAMRILE